MGQHSGGRSVRGDQLTGQITGLFRVGKTARKSMAGAAAVVALGATLSCGLPGGVAGDVRGGVVDGAGGSDGVDTGTGRVQAPVADCAVAAPGDSAARQLRGMWISTVHNGDWPRASGRPAAAQRAEYRRLLDTAQRLRLNAVFVQVRPAGDAFYPSPHEPWSQWLTGTQGQDPGYDVLEFLLTEAHARNLEFHAWFNPYRASTQPNRRRLVRTHPARRHPGWAVRHGSTLWYDPGLPQVRKLTTSVVLDVVRRYDIDGVHFDDYFYPYPGGGKFDDAATFARYGGGRSRAAWRRHNVNTLIQGVGERVRAAKPWVQFSVSPVGVWRNHSTDPRGSRTRALQSYDSLHADTRRWVREGWVDAIIPQLYWPIGGDRADYRVLVEWWARQVAGTPVRLVIGQAAYRVGQAGPWRRPGELARHLRLNARHPQVRGDVFFSARSLVADTRGFATRLRVRHYRRPALIPAVAGRPGEPPAPIDGLTARQQGTDVHLRWQPSPSGAAVRTYAVYRTAGAGEPCAPAPATLVATVRGSDTQALDTTVAAGERYTYHVTALDRLHRESPLGQGVSIVVQRG